MTNEFRWIALILTGIITFVFFLQLIVPDLTDILSLNLSNLIVRPWTIFTYLLAHGSFSHLYSNMFALVLFGSLLERVVGYRNFIALFVVSGIISGFGSLLFYSSVIGASGAIFGIIGALTVLRPKMTVLALGIPVPIIIAFGVYVALNVTGFFYPGDIAYAGHIFGMVTGLLVGSIWIKKFREPKKSKNRIRLDEKYFREWEEKHIRKS